MQPRPGLITGAMARYDLDNKTQDKHEIFDPGLCKTQVKIRKD